MSSSYAVTFFIQSKTSVKYHTSKKRWCTVSSSWPQNVHNGEASAFQMNKDLLVGSNRCNSRTWNHLSCLSEVHLWHFANIFSGSLNASFNFQTEVGTVSDQAVTNWTLLFPFLMSSHAFVWNCLQQWVKTISVALFYSQMALKTPLYPKKVCFCNCWTFSFQFPKWTNWP